MTRSPHSSRSFLLPQARLNRRGFALVAALLSVVLIDVLVAGVFFAIAEETRAGRAEVVREAVLEACESAIVMTVTDPGVRLPEPIGISGTIARYVIGLAPDAIVYITRLDSTRYSIVAESVREPVAAGGSLRVGIVVSSSVGIDHSIAIDPIFERPWFRVF